jgi:hypothetical protein
VRQPKVKFVVRFAGSVRDFFFFVIRPDRLLNGYVGYYDTGKAAGA